MHKKLVPAMVLLGWQGAAAILAVLGQADTVLSALPDPAWFAAMVVMLLSPPGWLRFFTIGVAIALLVWAAHEWHGRGRPPSRTDPATG